MKRCSGMSKSSTRAISSPPGATWLLVLVLTTSLLICRTVTGQLVALVISSPRTAGQLVAKNSSPKWKSYINRPYVIPSTKYNKRPLGLTAPLSNNTRSMIYSPMNTKWPWFGPFNATQGQMSWCKLKDHIPYMIYYVFMKNFIWCSI